MLLPVRSCADFTPPGGQSASLGRHLVVAAVLVGEERPGALVGPLHRPSERARGVRSRTLSCPTPRMSASWLRIANTPWPGATRVHLSFDLSNEHRPALGSI